MSHKLLGDRERTRGTVSGGSMLPTELVTQGAVR